MADTPPPSMSDSLQRPGCLRWAVMLLIALMLTTGALVWFFLDTIKSGALWLRDLTGHLTHQQITGDFPPVRHGDHFHKWRHSRSRHDAD